MKVDLSVDELYKQIWNWHTRQKKSSQSLIFNLLKNPDLVDAATKSAKEKGDKLANMCPVYTKHYTSLMLRSAWMNILR